MDRIAANIEARRLERLEEALWVTQAQAGDRAAFVSLMKRYEGPILYYLRRLVPTGDAALDLHQEVWIDVYRGLAGLQAPEAFRVWLYRIAQHKAAQFFRSEPASVELTEDAFEDVASGAEDLDAEAIHTGLAILPPAQREILTLHYLNDLSTDEVARILDCPQGTVKSRLHHARRALRVVIERKKL